MKQKYKFKWGVMMVLIALSLQWNSCGSDDPVVNITPTETERVTAILTSHNWNIQSVTVDGVDQSALFTNFSISFTSSGFSSTNGDPVWPASGTWSFANDTATSFTRSDGLTITLIEAVDTSLKMQLTWSKSTIGGRNSSVAGVHVFSLN